MRSSRSGGRRALVVAAVLAAAVGVWSAERAASHAGASRPAVHALPSIVLVVSDDQRWDTIWGMPTVQEALAAHGITFANSFVVNPLCCPSRASLLTGRYSHSTGVYLNSGPRGGFAAFRDPVSLATVLHERGYTTGFFGKYLNGYGDADHHRGYVPPGWDRWTAFFGGPRYYDYRLTDGPGIAYHPHRAADYSTTVLAREAAAFVRTAPQPFFVVLAPYAPHEPATPPPGYGDAFAHFSWWRPPSFNERDVSDKPTYIRRLAPLTPRQVQRVVRFRREQLEAALGIDDGVRALLRALEKRDILETSLIVYTSDNGVAWGEHPLLAARKLVPYEEPIRVPLVIRYDPLIRERPSQNGHLVLNIDLAPTLAALAGTRMPDADGRSLLPLFTGAARAPWRHDFLVEHVSGPPQPKVPTYCAVRGERYKYVLYQTGEQELYDLVRDPHELENLAGHHPLAATQARLRSRLSALCRPRPPGFTAIGEP